MPQIAPPVPLSNLDLNIETPTISADLPTLRQVYEAIAYCRAVQLAGDTPNSKVTMEQVVNARTFETKMINAYASVANVDAAKEAMAELIEPVTTSLNKIEGNVAKIKTDVVSIKAKMKNLRNDMRELKSSVNTVKGNVAVLQSEVLLIRIDAAKGYNRQLLEGNVTPFVEVLSPKGQSLVEVSLAPLLSGAVIRQLTLEDLRKYYKFYYPDEWYNNKSAELLREELCIAIGCINLH